MSKTDLKEKAVALRKKGFSYSEILKEIPVARSTLSLWLRKVGLAKRQKHLLTEKKMAGILRGGAARREQRLKLTKAIHIDAEADMAGFNLRDLWLIGIALYWAEGNKERSYRVSQRVAFSNSDGEMVRVFITWLVKCLSISREDIKCELYVHETHKARIPEIINFWSEKTGFDQDHFTRIYYKRSLPKRTYRKNTGLLYNGLVRVNIASSTSLNRKIAGWVQGIIKNCGIV